MTINITVNYYIKISFLKTDEFYIQTKKTKMM